MQVGVERFIGERLQQALDYRVCSKSALAKECSISPASITNYLNGARKPSSGTFEKLCSVLGFTPNFFLKSTIQNGDAPRLWRSLVDAHKKARKKANSILSWQEDLYKRYRSIFDLPLYDLQKFEYEGHFSTITHESIDALTLLLRNHWGMGIAPVKNLMRTLERSGVVVTRANLESQKLDAVSTWFDDTPHILLNSFKNSCARSRFDLAHELGHLILHRNVSQEEYSDDEHFHEIEHQAHYFASSLLLPEEGFLMDVWAPTLKCFVGMKPKWKVSIQAMIRRSLDLKAISNKQYSYLNINISKEGWRKKEPYDDKLIPEKSRLFAKCIERMEEKSPRLEEFYELCIPEDILEEMCDLESNYFTSHKETLDNLIEFRTGL